MTKILYAELPLSNFIIARNWDRLGGRVTEVVNGMYLAQRFDVPFRFVWPSEDLFPEVEELLKLFSPEFLKSHLLDSASVMNIPETTFDLDGKLSVEEFSALLNDSETFQAIRISNSMKLPKFAGDSHASLLADYARVSDSIWSRQVQDYARGVAEEYRNVCILHGRFGDLVTGQWNNWVDPSKYITALQIEEVLLENANNCIPTQLISDSEELLRLFPRIFKPKSGIFDSSLDLSSDSRQLVTDLMRMKCSKEVVGPELSAFSTFGARLGGKEVRKLKRPRVNIWQVSNLAQKTEILWSRAPSQNKSLFISRDIDQYLNSLSGIHDLQVLGEVTMAALRADPANVVSLNNCAIFYALSGQKAKCENSISLAKKISLGVLNVHHDPMFMTLTSEYLSNVILLLSQKIEGAELSQGSKTPQINSEMLDLEPYQIDKQWVIESLGRINLHLNEQIDSDTFAMMEFSSEVLNRLLYLKFTGPVRNVFVFNVLQSILEGIFSNALAQELGSITETMTGRWTKAARGFLAWFRERRRD